MSLGWGGAGGLEWETLYPPPSTLCSPSCRARVLELYVEVQMIYTHKEGVGANGLDPRLYGNTLVQDHILGGKDGRGSEILVLRHMKVR